MIYCKVGKCPVDNKIPLCCMYCNKNKNCANICKRKNLSCGLSDESENKKKSCGNSSIENI